MLTGDQEDKDPAAKEPLPLIDISPDAKRKQKIQKIAAANRNSNSDSSKASAAGHTLMLDHLHPPRNLEDWFAQDGTDIFAELQRARDHLLFNAHTTIAFESASGNGKLEPEDLALFGDPEGDPIQDLEDWLRFLKRHQKGEVSAAAAAAAAAPGEQQ